MMISVVIPTVERAEMLRHTLAALHHQQYHDLEVIVVHGPADDGTDEVVAGHADVMLLQCPVRNVSVARNLGLRHASGELVAFLDDDAVPEFNWLADLSAGFDHTDVAGVGGLVLDHTGTAFQSRFLSVDRFGTTGGRDDHPYDTQAFPGSFRIPYLPGGNALFRRTALIEVGGYDETFTYYHDDTDVSVRLIDSGFALRQIAGGVVHHHFAPSSLRNPQRVITDVRPIVRSATYFTFIHGAAYADESELQRRSHLVRNHFVVLAAAGVDQHRRGEIEDESHLAWREGREAARQPPLLLDLEPAGPMVDGQRPDRFTTRSLARPVVVLDVALSQLVGDRQARVVAADGGDAVELVDSTWVHHVGSRGDIARELERMAEWVDDALVLAAPGAVPADVEALLKPTDESIGGARVLGILPRRSAHLFRTEAS